MTSYPIPHTHIYPVYCYENFTRSIWSIGCTSQLIISTTALLTCIPLVIVLKRLFAKKKKQKIKIASFACMLALQFMQFFYYFFIFSRLSQVLVYSTNMLQAIIQILICYIYCLRSSRLFSDRKTWFRALKIISIISIGIYFVLVLIAIVKDAVLNKSGDIYLSCTTGIYFVIDFL